MTNLGLVCGIAIALLFGFYCNDRNTGDRAAQKAPNVYVAQEGTIMIQGQPFFPIGCYQLPKGAEPYHQLAEAGFSLVQCPATREALDKAHAAGLKAWVSFGSNLDLSKDTQNRKKYIQETVKALADHPALLVWESMDEPAWSWKDPAKPQASADGLAQGHQFLKSLDPNHPIWINHAPRNLVKTIINFSRGVDIVSCDIYPIIPCGLRDMYAIQPDGTHGDLLNQTASAVGEYTTKMRRVAGSNRAVWMVLQGFAWEGLRKLEEQDAAKILYPTYTQTRFMAYHAVIRGANGILYWGTGYLPQSSEFWTGLERVTKELSSMAPIFLAPTLKASLDMDYTEMGFSMDTAVETMIKSYDDKVYLVAANTSPYPAQVTFSGLQHIKVLKNLEVLNEQRSVVVKDGVFSDYFEGFGVHVYVEK